MKKFFIKVKGYLRTEKAFLPLICGLFALVSICIYFNGLHNDFLYDDQYFIVQNLYLRSPAFLPQLLKMDVFHFAPQPRGYYRPMQMLSYGLDYFFWKLDPFGYHLINILIHSANSFLVFLLVYRLFRNKFLALLTGIFFCIHPIHIGAVTVIGGRSNILEMMFMLLSLIMLARYYIEKHNGKYLLSLLLFVLAILSREGALLLPFFGLLCALVLKVDKKRLILSMLPLASICGLYLLLRTHFMPSDKLKFYDILSWQKISAFFYLVPSYVNQLILPWGLAVKMPFLKAGLTPLLTILSFIFISGAALLVIAKNKAATFGSAFYLLGLIPLFNLLDNVSFFGKILSEPYVYMASVGFFIVAACMFLKSYGSFPRATAAAIILVILFYAGLTTANNRNYRNEEAFYNYLLQVDKDNTIAHLNLGNIYLGRKMYGEAEKEARFVLEREADAWDAYLLLGNISRQKGDLSAAAGFYKQTVALNPGAYQAMNNLGLIYRAQGADDKAADAFEKAIAINPESVTAINNLADLLMAKRSYKEALSLCQQALRLSPQDVGARVKTGIILAESGHLREAESAFLQVLQAHPDSVEAWRNLGVLYANSGYFDRAISFWERVLVINPQDSETRKNIEQAKVLMNKKRGH